MVYTGTMGVLQLTSDSRQQVELWIGRDSGTKKDLIPVPAYYWKVVVRPDTGHSVVFVGINNPYLSRITRSKAGVQYLCSYCIL